MIDENEELEILSAAILSSNTETVRRILRETKDRVRQEREAFARALVSLDTTIDRLSADLALTREALDRYAALDPDGARAVMARLSKGV